MFGRDLANTSYTPNPGPSVLSIRWRFPQEPDYLPSEIWSVPAVVNGVIYFGTGATEVESFTPGLLARLGKSVIALNAENGDVMWHNDQLGTFAFSSPAVVDGRVFIASDQGNAYALNAENGDVIWNRDLISGPENLAWRISSPAVTDGKVLITTQLGYTYALNVENGDIIWARKVDEHVQTSPAVAGGKLFITSDNIGWSGHLSALNAGNGNLVWIYPIDNDLFGSSPTVAYGKVFVVTKKGWIHAVYAENGGLAWKYGMGEGAYYIRPDGPPAAAHGMIYVFKNPPTDERVHTLLALNADNGSVVWESLPSWAGLRVIVADNVIFAGWHLSELWMLDAYTGNLLQKIKLSVPDGLSVVGDKLYVTSHGRFVACIGLPETGAEVESPKTNLLPWLAILGLLLIGVVGLLSFVIKIRLLRRR